MTLSQDQTIQTLHHQKVLIAPFYLNISKGREGGREGGRERAREGAREGGREGGERGREVKEREREGGEGEVAVFSPKR